MFPGKRRLVLVLRKHNRSQAVLARFPNGLAIGYAGVFVEDVWNMTGPR
jgi:hypothetical protein